MTVYLTKIIIKFLYLSSNVTFEYIRFTKDQEKTHTCFYVILNKYIFV